MVLENQRVLPLPPKQPSNLDRNFQGPSQAGSSGMQRDSRVLGWSILRGGFLGFGLFAAVLVLALRLTFSHRGVPPSWWLLYIALYVVAALTYGCLRWLFSGRSWRRGSKERGWLRWSRRSLAALVSIPILMAPFVLLGPHRMVLYSTPIQVKGQVVDARTGEPIRGARVYILRGNTLAQAERDLATLLEFEANHPEETGLYGSFGGRATTDEEGRFDLTLRRTYCCASGPLVPRKYPPPFHGANMIFVEMDGYMRTFFPTATGTWRVLEQRGAFDVYAVANAEVLRLPRTH